MSAAISPRKVAVARVVLWPITALLRALPDAWADALGRALGWGWYRLVPIRRGVARRNVHAALGLQDGAGEPIVRGMYLHLGRSFVELLRFGGRPLEAFAEGGRIRVEGLEHIAGVGERGILMLTAHLGNWELLVRVGLTLDRPVSVVTRRFKAGWAEAAWRALRRGGPRLLPAGASARATVAALERGEIVGYVLDQHCPSPKAVRAPFFGRMASTTPDLARLARLTDAAVLPAFTWREGRRHVVRFGPPLALQRSADRAADVEGNTRRCLAVVEEAIRAHPEQWLWIHRRWKPPARAAAGITSAAGPRG